MIALEREDVRSSGALSAWPWAALFAQHEAEVAGLMNSRAIFIGTQIGSQIYELPAHYAGHF